MMAREPYPAVPCVQVNEWALHGPFFRPPSAISRQKTGSFPAEVRYLGFNPFKETILHGAMRHAGGRRAHGAGDNRTRASQERRRVHGTDAVVRAGVK